VKCGDSTVEIEQVNTGGPVETVFGKIKTLAFPEGSCNCRVTVTALGSVEIHPDKEVIDDNGILTGTGTRATITCSGLSCIFGTGGTNLGTLDGSEKDPIVTANASLKYLVGDASNFTCTLGTGAASWKAEYTVIKPLGLFVI